MDKKSLAKCLTTKTEKFDLPRIDCEFGELYYQDNGCNVLGVAHLDYVDFDEPKYWGSHVQCCQLDDRLGVWMLLHLLPSMGIKLDVLLTDNEECGDSTGQWFNPTKQYNWIIEFDRQGTDIVFYQYGKFAKHWRDIPHGHGSYSDISFMDHIGVMAANIGIGYHCQHTSNCYADLRDTYRQARLFKKFYDKNKDKRFPYAEKKRKSKTKRKKYDIRYTGYGRNYLDYEDERLFRHNAASWKIHGVDRCEICGIRSWDTSIVETYERGQVAMCEYCLTDYRIGEEKQNSEVDALYYRAKKNREKF